MKLKMNKAYCTLKLQLKPAMCKVCFKSCGLVPKDANNVVCFSCNEAKVNKIYKKTLSREPVANILKRGKE